MISIISPGLYYDMPTDDCNADPCPKPSLTQSVAKGLIDQSPLHPKQQHPRLAVKLPGEEDEAEKYDKAKAISNAAHAMLLGRGKAIEPIEYPNFTSKEARAAAVMAGREPILHKHHLIAQQMVLAAQLQLANIEGARHAFRPDAGDWKSSRSQTRTVGGCAQ